MVDRFHIDGLRVDAVASMLYLDYSRGPANGCPIPTARTTTATRSPSSAAANEYVYAEAPGAVTIAEESTSWSGVSSPVFAGGLGFGFKWNMGWITTRSTICRAIRCIGAGTTTR